MLVPIVYSNHNNGQRTFLFTEINSSSNEFDFNKCTNIITNWSTYIKSPSLYFKKRSMHARLSENETLTPVHKQIYKDI